MGGQEKIPNRSMRDGKHRIDRTGRPRVVRPPVRCCKCQREWPTMVILKDDLWKSIEPEPDERGRRNLCFVCIEQKLGRALSFDDLKPCGNTNTMLLGALMFSTRTSSKPWADQVVQSDEFRDYFKKELMNGTLS